MSEPVLERSVLERKERDELLTIAKALGAKPPARAKKADLVDLILTTAGISPGGAEDAPAEKRATAAVRLSQANQIEVKRREQEVAARRADIARLKAQPSSSNSWAAACG